MRPKDEVIDLLSHMINRINVLQVLSRLVAAKPSISSHSSQAGEMAAHLTIAYRRCQLMLGIAPTMRVIHES